ncbi:MAG: hypothetical protein ABI533_00955 [Betaproteobacteria bacterium]
MRTTARFAAVLVAAIVAACGGLPPRDPPRVEIVGVSLQRVDGPDAYFSIDVELTNRGSDELVIGALQATLAIEGESVAQAALTTPPPVRIPPHGTARAELAAHAGMDAMLRAVAAAMRRGAMLVAPGARPSLRYTVSGSATLGGGYRLPFTRSGELGERSQ